MLVNYGTPDHLRLIGHYRFQFLWHATFDIGYFCMEEDP